MLEETGYNKWELGHENGQVVKEMFGVHSYKIEHRKMPLYYIKIKIEIEQCKCFVIIAHNEIRTPTFLFSFKEKLLNLGIPKKYIYAVM